VTVITDIHAHARVLRIENGISHISRREIKLLPESRMHMRNMVLAIFTQVTAIRIDHGRSIEIQTGHLFFIDGNHNRHAMLRRKLLHQFGSGALGHSLGKLVPADVLLRTEIRTIKKFLEAQHLDFFPRRLGDQLAMLVDHRFLDLRERVVAAQNVMSLNQAAAHDPRHGSDLRKRPI
jgi:hypothetical protein